MSIYYLTATLDNELLYFALDSTSTVSKVQSGSATSFPLESGREVTDNYVNRNVVVNMSGIITDTKTSERAGDENLNKTTAEFISQLEDIKTRGITFSIHMANPSASTGSSVGLEVITGCVFESLTISQDSTIGSVRGGRNAYRVSFTAKQLRFGRRARRFTSRPAQQIARSSQIQTNQNGNLQETSEAKSRLFRIDNQIYSEAQRDRLVRLNPSLAGDFIQIQEVP